MTERERVRQRQRYRDTQRDRADRQRQGQRETETERHRETEADRDRGDRDTHRDNTLLHRDKDLSTCRLFFQSVPDDNHSNTQYIKQNSLKYAREKTT